MDRPSGDQNGRRAPSVPAKGCAVVVASDRSHRRFGSPEATNTICRPSGESANDSVAAGVTISTRVSGGGVSRRCRSAGTASPVASSAAPASIHGKARCHVDRAAGAAATVVAALSGAPASILAISMRACADVAQTLLRVAISDSAYEGLQPRRRARGKRCHVGFAREHRREGLGDIFASEQRAFR